MGYLQLQNFLHLVTQRLQGTQTAAEEDQTAPKDAFWSHTVRPSSASLLASFGTCSSSLDSSSVKEPNGGRASGEAFNHHLVAFRVRQLIREDSSLCLGGLQIDGVHCKIATSQPPARGRNGF